ncbi:MAG TPA: GNAT family N-acetyltransferase [Acidimicrobiales bacterium]|nr:GNAT family N-acetyltransferase [Acidimicrobiales bacterium]
MRGTSIATLTASWERLVTATGGEVDRTPQYVAARSSHDVFNNALLLEADAEAVDSVRRFYARVTRWALWTADEAGDALADSVGLVRDGGTTDMGRALDHIPPRADDGVRSADPAAVAAINGLSPDLVVGASGFAGLVADDSRAGLLLFRHQDDVHLSFLATKAEHRRAGLATRLVTAALGRARLDGAKTATLQSTPAALSLYERAGFTALGRWAEWAPPPR